MRWRPFHAKPLGDIEQGDLQGLIDDEIEETYFVEYKSAWESRKVARAVASFANTWGGTLVIGMEAQGLKPTQLVGIEDDGGLEERVVNTIRTSVAPVPAFAVRSVGLDNGRACVVVEVPDGTQPPYILISTGQILVRTPASSEPVGINDRESLDRLFARGERGFRWAKDKINDLVGAVAGDDQPYVWTVPAVADGVDGSRLIFRQQFIETLAELGRRFPHVTGVTRPEWVTGPDFAQATHQSFQGDPEGSFFQLRAEVTGIVRTTWRVSQEDAGYTTLKVLLEGSLPMHRAILEDLLEHRGDVVVLAANRWLTESGEARRLRTVRDRVSVADVGSQELLEALDRDLQREMGGLVFEPE